MKIGDRVRIIGTESRIEKEIVGITENGNYELSGDKIWEWTESELELIKGKAFDNDKYCNLIGEYSDLCREIGKLKREKEQVEKEMHRMVYQFGVDCEKDFEEV